MPALRYKYEVSHPYSAGPLVYDEIEVWAEQDVIDADNWDELDRFAWESALDKFMELIEIEVERV